MSDEVSELSARVLRAYLAEAGDLARRIARALETLRTEGPGSEALAELLRDLHTLKGTSGAVGVPEVRDLAHEMETALAPVRDDRVAVAGALEEQLFGHVDRIAEILAGLGGGAPEEAAPAAAAGEDAPSMTSAAAAAQAGGGDGDVLHVEAGKIDALHTMVGELIVGGLQSRALGEQARQVREVAAEFQSAWDSLRTELLAVREHLPEARWAVLAGAVERLSPRVTEAVSSSSLLTREIAQVTSQNDAVVRGLDEGVSELRLVPIQPFLEDLGRVVRNAARATGKPARLVVNAEGAEMDRLVLMRLRDPLVHLLNNAVVHGLEDAATRAGMGKAPEGTLRIEVAARGERAVIRFMDDGGGIDVAAVQAKGVARGLVSADAHLDDAGVLDLLTNPGFSTRETADELAGRGIGLDVVATTIRSLDGRLGLDNLPGIGCVFTIDVPVSTSTTTGCRVRVGDREFGILMKDVEKLVRLPAEDLRCVQGRTFAFIDSEPIAALPLGELIGLPGADATDGARVAVVVKQRRDRLALLVDEVPTEETLVVKSLGPCFKGAELFLGGAVQADHRVLPLLHTPELLRRGRRGEARGARVRGPAAGPGPAEAARRRVLAVDDSLTMRSLMRQLLEGAGYAVTLAPDGAEALARFVDAPAPFDAVVTDLEMPNVDGIELCRRLRDEVGTQVPIVVVTAVPREEDRESAMKAGADSCIQKSRFEEGSFLALLAELTGLGEASP